jgi:hypothetical protein
LKRDHRGILKWNCWMPRLFGYELSQMNFLTAKTPFLRGYAGQDTKSAKENKKARHVLTCRAFEMDFNLSTPAQQPCQRQNTEAQ